MSNDLGTMTIETHDGHRYDLRLCKSGKNTELAVEDWEKLMGHFIVTYYDHIVVNIDGEGDIFLATVFYR
jgi:hypothetical protein